MSKAPRLNCRNWECGVILPILPTSTVSLSSHEDQIPEGLTGFEGMIPVPMSYPGEEYGMKKPWFQGEEGKW